MLRTNKGKKGEVCPVKEEKVREGLNFGGGKL